MTDVTPISTSPIPTPAVPVKATPIAAASPAHSSIPSVVATSKPVSDLPTRAWGAIVRAVPVGYYHLVRVGPAGIAGATATIAAVIIGITALVGGRNATDALTARIADARHGPIRVSSTEEGIAKVMASLPTRDQIPTVMGVMLEQAQASGVELDTGHYAYSPPKPGGVGRYELEFPVKAEYPKVRAFIDRTLTAVPSAGLDKLHIERKGVGDTVVSADVRFVVFVRSEPEP